MTGTSEIRTIVLAGGEGRRLAPLTRALYGEDLPKQFAVFARGRSMLQQTVARAARISSPDRILVVVSRQRERIARDQLRAWPGVELAVQPRSDLDTGPGVLFPLARVRAVAPRSRVVVLPADHYFTDDGPLLHALRASENGIVSKRIGLVGVKPDRAETDYGWIVPGRPLGGRSCRSFEVTSFVEKPDEREADLLRARGALWNTFISTGPVAAYWRLARAYLPKQAHLLEAYAQRIGTAEEQSALAAAYQRMPAANFSRDLLSRARRLAVLPVAGTGWSDWGSPRRVFESLAGTEHHTRLVARIAEPAGAVPLAS